MSPTPRPALPSTRRQRGRDAAAREIKAAALEELRRYGARGVTMRGVARAIDMTPSGLYRYFNDHSALLAALCVDAQESLRAALQDARTAYPEDDHCTRWFRGSVVLRLWAMEHVDEYALVVSPRLAGVNPEHPDLATATARLMSIPVGTVARAISNGALAPVAGRPVMSPLPPTMNSDGTGVPRRARAIATDAVSALVGAVSLEALGPLGGSTRAGDYASYSVQVMRGMGWVETPALQALVLAS